MGVRAMLLVPNGVGPNSACKSPFIKCINHYSLINFHFSSDTDGVECVHGSPLPRRGICLLRLTSVPSMKQGRPGLTRLGGGGNNFRTESATCWTLATSR